jgi:hypothetical protein
MNLLNREYFIFFFKKLIFLIFIFTTTQEKVIFMVFFEKTACISIRSSGSTSVRWGSSQALNQVNDIIAKAVEHVPSEYSYQGILPFGSVAFDQEKSLSGRINTLKTCLHFINFRNGGRVDIVPQVLANQQFNMFNSHLSSIKKVFTFKKPVNREQGTAKLQDVLEKVLPKHEEFEHIGLQLHHLRTEKLSQQLILDELLLSFEESNPLIICQKKIIDGLDLEIATLKVLWGKIYQENFLELRKLMEITQPSSPVACTVLEEHFTVLGITFGDILESLMTFLPLLGYIMILCRMNSAIMIEVERPFQMHDHDDFDFFFK